MNRTMNRSKSRGNRYKDLWYRKMHASILTGAFCLAALTGCGASNQESTGNPSKTEAQTETDDVSSSVTDTDNLSDLPEDADEETIKSGSLGEFSMQDITGKTYTNEIFQDYELTMVNVFTTWCTPCINEIPDLEKLHQEVAGQGVQVIGIVLDTVTDANGTIDEEAVEKAKVLAERTGASYPFLIPDADGLQGRLHSIQAFPTTFFVDKNGSVIGKTYTGSNSLDGWKQVVEAELANLKGAQP